MATNIRRVVNGENHHADRLPSFAIELSFTSLLTQVNE